MVIENNENENNIENIEIVEEVETTDAVEKQPVEQTPIRQEPTYGSPRFNQVYGKMKASQRENEALKDEILEMKKMMSEFMSSNKEQQFNSSMNAINQKVLTAWDSGDKELAMQALAELDTLYKSKVPTIKKEEEPKIKKSQPVVNEVQNINPVDQYFASKYTWYGKDITMTNTAIQVARELEHTSQFSSLTLDQKLDEVARLTLVRANQQKTVPNGSGVVSTSNYTGQSQTKKINIPKDEFQEWKYKFGNTLSDDKIKEILSRKYRKEGK